MANKTKEMITEYLCKLSTEEKQSDVAQLLIDCAFEITRLQNICEQTHDRLLRGDSDKALLELLRRSWKIVHIKDNCN